MERFQIKGRRVSSESSSGERLGSIDVEAEWDVVLIVLLNAAFEAQEIYEARRPEIETALAALGTIARNGRGALPVAKFKAIGKQIWPRSAHRVV